MLSNPAKRRVSSRDYSHAVSTCCRLQAKDAGDAIAADRMSWNDSRQILRSPSPRRAPLGRPRMTSFPPWTGMRYYIPCTMSPFRLLTAASTSPRSRSGTLNLSKVACRSLTAANQSCSVILMPACAVFISWPV